MRTDSGSVRMVKAGRMKEPRTNARPPMSFTQLIQEALQSGEGKAMLLTEIYEKISANHPFFRIDQSHWKVGRTALRTVCNKSPHRTRLGMRCRRPNYSRRSRCRSRAASTPGS